MPRTLSPTPSPTGSRFNETTLCQLRRLGGGLSSGLFQPVAAAGPALQLAIVPRYNGTALVFDKPVQANAAAQQFSVTRLDFLLSDFALHRSDGTWLQTTNWQACIKLGESRSNAIVNDLEPGSYDRIRFHVGLMPALNHSDPALYPPGHPLNPNLNGLHWGWAGGYVFLALEGLWRDERGQWRGYSFHLANDPQLMTIELPVVLELGADKSLVLTLDLDGLLSRKLGEDNDSTHSRKGDELALSLRDEVEKAFTVAGVRAVSMPAVTRQTHPEPEQRQAATASISLHFFRAISATGLAARQSADGGRRGIGTPSVL